MSKKMLIHSLLILSLAHCTPYINAMAIDNASDAQAAQILCNICYSNKKEDQFISLACGHRFCKNCLQRTIDMALQSQSTANLRCLSCWLHQITQEEISKIATSEQQEKLGTIQLKEWLTKQSQIKYCPTPDCNFAFINDSKCQSNITCKECHKTYCAQCLIKHPEYMSCHAAQEKYISAADKANQAWKNQHSKQCPQCHISIEKNFGCDHMTCSKCRYEFCWKCLRKYPCPDGYSCREITPAIREQTNTRADRINQVLQPTTPMRIFSGQVWSRPNTTFNSTYRNTLNYIEPENRGNQIAVIEVRADMPRDFDGFVQFLTQSDRSIAIVVHDNFITIRSRMPLNRFNMLLDQANTLYR